MGSGAHREKRRWSTKKCTWWHRPMWRCTLDQQELRTMTDDLDILRAALAAQAATNAELLGRLAAADALVAELMAALDTAITLCHIPERNQDDAWYKQFEAVIAFHES